MSCLIVETIMAKEIKLPRGAVAPIDGFLLDDVAYKKMVYNEKLNKQFEETIAELNQELIQKTEPEHTWVDSVIMFGLGALTYSIIRDVSK